MSESYSKFTNKYSLSKTLRFELKPTPETSEWIKEKGFIQKDEKRAEMYKKVKEIIDEYHKTFIQETLQDKNLKNLDEYFELYKVAKRSDDQNKQLEDIQKQLRKTIVSYFKASPKWKSLFKKELIKNELPEFISNESDQELVEAFNTFTTYFTGFHDNRKNMYSDEDKSTSIANRLIQQNLPRFANNLLNFEKIKKSPLAKKFNEISQNLEPIIQDYSIEEFFTLDAFNNTLTQEGIDQYNAAIGGYTTDDGNKIQGLNEYINLYNQQQKDKKDKLPQLIPLYKQILSDRIQASFIPEKFESDKELIASLPLFYKSLYQKVLEVKNNDTTTLPELLPALLQFDLKGIYIANGRAVSDISNVLFGHWSYINNAIKQDYDTKYKGRSKPGTEKYEETRDKELKKTKSYTIADLNSIIEAYINKQKELLKKDEESPDQAIVKFQGIERYFMDMGKSQNEEGETFVDRITSNYKQMEDALKNFKDKNLSKDDKTVALIKTFLDSIKDFQHFVKPLLGSSDMSDIDALFYSEFVPLWDELDAITPYYNKVRNYMTQKPYKTEKFKINFDNSTLLAGWDVNKEKDNTSVLLLKDGLYYLAVMDKKNNKIFEKAPKANTKEVYQKVNYKLLPGASKMLPKVFFATSNSDKFQPSEAIHEIRNHASHTKSGKPQGNNEKKEFNLKDCHQMIDFFKTSINKHEDWKNFDFKFLNTNSYKSINEFYKEVEDQGYKITFTDIDTSYIDQLVADGKLYLFQIYNKDFSPYSKGKPNLHTMYWKMLFDPENLKDVVYKLNGEAEIFYRRGSIAPKDRVIHKANQPIENKNENNEKPNSTFKYDIIKNRRYTEDKFQFHVPITLNFKAAGNDNINRDVLEYLRESEGTHVIGIDRGERHLIYVSVINPKGEIVEQFSLNQIVNEYQDKKHIINYKGLLQEKEDQRKKARESWMSIENIKELKEGYISQVVHKVAQLMLKYNAIVALEDLNFGFKRGRQKVEKQVYQKFEKMLINKLNYYVSKDVQATKSAGLLHALQLTSKFTSFQKLGKQSGFLFYLPAWNTSKIDPVTGFVNYFDTRYKSIDKAQEFFSKFEDIRWNAEKDYFEFEVKKYESFNPKAKGTRQNWLICTHGSRLENYRNPDKNDNFDTREVHLSTAIKDLQETHNIDPNQNLKEHIISQKDKKFFASLFKLFRLTLQMRNSRTGTEEDYMVSPVADQEGIFYDSREYENLENPKLPKDADANGAYNIARKGMMIIDRIRASEPDDTINLAIKNVDWVQYAQK